jgi:hypothetical protein
MSLKHLRILDEDDDDPMLSAVNLVDVFLVLVVALLVALSIRQGASDTSASPVRQAGEAGMEMTVKTDGQEVKFKGTGERGAAQGVRAGVAYRLPDGQILYVPEAATSAPRAAAPALVAPALPAPAAGVR